MKVCRLCHTPKPLTEFHKEAKAKDGHKGACKPCWCAQAKAWRDANLAHIKERDRDWYLRNREKVIAKARAQYAADPERKKAYAREHRKVYDVGEVHDRRLARGRARYHANREREAERSRRYQQANTEKWRAYTAARRLRIGRTTKEIQARIAVLVKEPCVYCGSTENIEIDHVVPLARGGAHAPENLAPACRWCNRSKGARLLSEWRAA